MRQSRYSLISPDVGSCTPNLVGLYLRVGEISVALQMNFLTAMVKNALNRHRSPVRVVKSISETMRTVHVTFT